MSKIGAGDKALFPIKNIKTVVRLFKNQLENNEEPDLALLSIVTGFVENQLTARHNQANGSSEPATLPVFELETVEALYERFHSIITSAIEPNTDKSCATRELVKRVSDVIWNSLTRSYYKDRAHLQSLYSYLTDSKLDGFGVAFAVVAACQVLGYNDVHLALSEDHAWVVFGPNLSETAEVTWHGKGNEDKRGQEINKGIASRSWSYVNNRPVICTRHMEVAALVSAINPSLNVSADAVEVSSLQHELLWLLYDLGHLKRYPMAIGNLGDLEEIAPTRPEIKCEQLFSEAIESARKFYDNQHVYPYIYQGGFFYRHKRYKEAFESWANASDVIRLYNYSRDDEEIYKEFLEIANELIPNIMKLESSGFEANTLLKRPECFANLLSFYDGICQWEEGSATPVLHIGWAKHLVNTISKYDADIRAQVHIVCDRKEGKPFPKESSLLFHNNNNYENTSKPVLPPDAKDSSSLYPSIEALTAGCSEKILNPEYLLQRDGSPFVGLDQKEDSEEGKENGKPSTSKSPVPVETKEEDVDQPKDVKPLIVFHSQKMKELRDLILAEKLNTQAISLHLTAQSQVQIGKKSRGESDNTRPKRKNEKRKAELEAKELESKKKKKSRRGK